MMRTAVACLLLLTACQAFRLNHGAHEAFSVRRLLQSSSSTSSASAGGGGTTRSSAEATSWGGGHSTAVADGVAGPGDTVNVDAKAEAAGGQSATAIAKGFGDGSGVEVNAQAIAQAVGKGEGSAVAQAVADAARAPCNKQACPKDEAGKALVSAFALARNEGSGTAYADALAIGLTNDGASGVFATAVATIIAEQGCGAFKPTLAEARAKAEGKLRKFMDALDVDIKIAECLLPKCNSCCDPKSGSCACFGGSSSCGVFKQNSRSMWRCHSGCGQEPLCIC